MVYLVNQESKKQTKKISESQDKSDYYILCVEIRVIKP